MKNLKKQEKERPPPPPNKNKKQQNKQPNIQKTNKKRAESECDICVSNVKDRNRRE